MYFDIPGPGKPLSLNKSYRILKKNRDLSGKKRKRTRAPCFGRRFAGSSVPPPLPVSPPLSVYKTLTHFVSFGKNSTHFFCNSPRADVQNRVQNRDFSDNRRWEPYKNYCHEKSIRARQFVAGAEKRDFFHKSTDGGFYFFKTTFVVGSVNYCFFFE